MGKQVKTSTPQLAPHLRSEEPKKKQEDLCNRPNCNRTPPVALKARDLTSPVSGQTTPQACGSIVGRTVP